MLRRISAPQAALVLLAAATACSSSPSSATGAVLAQTGGAAGAACNPTYQGQGCSGMSAMNCQPNAAAASGGTWVLLATCGGGQTCVESANPANAAGEAKRIARCDTPSGADAGATAADSADPGAGTGGALDGGVAAADDGHTAIDSQAAQDGVGVGADAGKLDITIVGDSAGLDAAGGNDAGQTGGDIAKSDAGATPGGNWCDANCGKQAPSGCFCDAQCGKYGDCCLADGAKPTAANKTCAGSSCAMCNGASSQAAAVCGNAACEAGETKASCAEDCAGASTSNFCDGNCGKGGPAGCFCDSQCAQYGDCCMPDGSKPTSANKTCGGSTCAACNGSAPSSCGDGTCDPGETAQSCPADCKSPAACTTFAEVAPLLKAKCSQCHVYGNACATTQGAAGLISTMVQGGSMPPGGKAPLTADEKSKLKAWAAAGAPCAANGCP